MARKLFEDFMENAQRYDACEQYWQELVDRIAESLGQSGEWPRWIPRHYADGKTPIDVEYLPMYDGRSARLDRGFRIEQEPPTTDGLEIAAWVTEEGEPFDLPRQELVIHLSLSEESAQLAEALLRLWMAPETTIDEMRAFIEDNLPAEWPSAT
jgi:hypothetical protein